MRNRIAAMIVAAICAAFAPFEAAVAAERLPQDEIIYFVLPDRFANGDPANDGGGLRGDRLKTGFDPTHKGFYQGGDLRGLTQRLDYIAGLGATAIWLGPIYQNKPVQGRPGQESAGYHGYWITDFTRVDPHFGDDQSLRALVSAAHARGMKVYLDIITNHTADVIKYRECPANDCAYRSRAAFPYTRQGGVNGPAINDGFAGEQQLTSDNFAKLTRPDFAYTPYVPGAERQAKSPTWLNDPIYYHNRGETTFRGESSTHGDFAGLDDLFTEHPRVVAGMIDIYRNWIERFKIDGFRIDTARHVDSAFWQSFLPAMRERALAAGKATFPMFGEIYDPDPAMLARFTHVDGFDSVLDFAFQDATAATIAGSEGTARLARLFALDAIYRGGVNGGERLVTFVGNHDMGRFAHFVQRARPGVAEAEALARVRLAHALMLFSRGAPTIYYGDEQGMIGDGNDQDAREPMFGSRTPSYDDNVLLGTSRGPRDDKFDPEHPLYRAIAAMAKVRQASPALRRGTQIVRAYGDEPGLFAFSRVYGGREVLVAINTGLEPLRAPVEVEHTSAAWRALMGACAARAAAPGVLEVELAPLDVIVCAAEE